MKVYSTSLDIGEGAEGSVVMTAVVYVLHPDAIFSASRNSFLAILAILFTTFIVIIAVSPQKKRMQTAEPGATFASADKTVTDDLDDTAFSLPSIQLHEELDETYEADEYALPENQETYDDGSQEDISSREAVAPGNIREDNKPEGLFSPLTGIGWEQYLSDRLEAELVRAASSEQDLSLIVIRVAGLLHTDLISRKISQVLLDAFKFRDMVFEFGANGFAGILQNVNLDQAMKVADTLYAGIDSLLMEMSFEGQITIGITTRTARLLPASRMIEEAVSAAKKAEEEPSLPIVAFRANPEKYRDFVADNT
jgi:GGDEF domain-containing protein